MKNNALFLDRDGVINVDYGYVFRVEDFVFVDGIFTLCQWFVEKNYEIFIITNQAGIAMGYYQESELHNLNDWLIAQFKKNNIEIRDIYYCPYHNNAKIKKYRRESPDRKPGTGMIDQIVKKYDINIDSAVLIGDRVSDIAAGIGAGIQHCFYLRGKYELDSNAPVFDTHYQLLNYIKTIKLLT